MASSKSRQRKLERDRYERKLVRQAQQQRRKRQIQAGVGAFLALALIGVGSAWLAGVFDRDESEPSAQPDLCTWLPRDADDPNRVDVGTPPDNPPTSGQHVLSIDLAAGDTGGQVEVAVDAADDPCGTASLIHLSEQGFYDETVCHEITDGALRCGDPSATGLGGPSYAFWGENMPLPPVDADPEAAEAEPLYPAGTVAFGDVSGENGSQFLIFFEDFHADAPLFPVIGAVADGQDVVEEIGAAGVAEGTTTPAEEVTVRSLTVRDAGTAPTS
ncbi:peptidylprolyl isomerase [Natronosporangium hydrolyticum]|uniref:Peptidylprolyl isomerase n=1 Tax=Natronosporangium hydrolyticum TaxID=2811111 RepID=A0A895YQB9_9ACTN|nr:peptidylprolyl isomerase [Natronosporangium hydrolyticum]QSB16936.1 peptidylprolyl isomerase [Natronosporangium hydrolyticum]